MTMPLPWLCVGLAPFLLLVMLMFCVLLLRQIYDIVAARILRRLPTLLDFLSHGVSAASRWVIVGHR